MSSKIIKNHIFLFLLGLFIIDNGYSRGSRSIPNESPSELEAVNKVCKKRVNLLRHKWTVKRNIPQLDQGPVGLCSAYAFSHLIDGWREIHGLRITKEIALTDPLYYALIWGLLKTDNDIKLWSRDFEVRLYKGIKKYGVCRSEIINKSITDFAKKNELLPNSVRLFLEVFFDFYKGKKEKLAKVEDKYKEFKNFFKRRGTRFRKLYNSETELKKLYESVIDIVMKGDMGKNVFENIFSGCTDKRSIYLHTKKLPPFSINKSQDYREKRKVVLEQLQKKNIVGIGYNSDQVEYKKPMPYAKSTHASVLVGNRVRDGKCQFLLHNSWGNYCGYEWECQKDRHGQEMGVWVDADLLMYQAATIWHFKL